MAWLFTTQSFIQIRQTIAKLQKKQKYGNPDLQKLNLSFAFPWHGQSPQTFVQIGVTIAELQKKQIYGNPDLEKFKFAICLFIARRIITQSFVQIGLTIT